MASLSPVSSNCQFHPDELSELMSMMAQENYSGATFSGGAASSTGTLSPLEDDLDIDIINVINPVSYGSISELDHHFHPAEFDVTSPAMGSFSQHQNQQVLGMYDQRMGGGYSNQLISDGYEFGVESYGRGFMSNSSDLVSPLTAGNRGIRCNKTPAIFEQNNVKVGRYTEEERRERILRYLKKRNQRNFNKKIKYVCRKTLAERRVRVRGRFARHNKEPCKEEVTRMEQNDTCPQQNNESYYYDISQIKMDDDEEWLQEAVASLLYVPYISG